VNRWLEPVAATAITLLGIGLTSAGAFVHAAPAVAPGSLLILIGSGWLGNALARRDVRLFGSRSD
jgi:hypothetical protein